MRYTLNMRGVSFIIFLLFMSSASMADMYHWTDEAGVLHVTDDLKNVPKKYRAKVNVIKTEPIEETSKPETIKESQPKEEAEGEELYGDYPLSWWRATLKERKTRLASLEKEYDDKEQFIEVFEKGRRLGQGYEEKDVETYEKYKEELPALEKKIKKLKQDLADLKDKARYHGVPKEIRE